LLFYKDARVHCEVLKIRASPDRTGASRALSGLAAEDSLRRAPPNLQDPTACSGLAATSGLPLPRGLY